MPWVGSATSVVGVHDCIQIRLGKVEVVCVLDRREVECHGSSTTTLAKKLRQLRKPNIGACMLERSHVCVTCARLSQFFWPGYISKSGVGVQDCI